MVWSATESKHPAGSCRKDSTVEFGNQVPAEGTETGIPIRPESLQAFFTMMLSIAMKTSSHLSVAVSRPTNSFLAFSKENGIFASMLRIFDPANVLCSFFLQDGVGHQFLEDPCGSQKVLRRAFNRLEKRIVLRQEAVQEAIGFDHDAEIDT